jgi:hypothetical protein
VKRTLHALLKSFFLGCFLLLLIAPLNQSFAVGSGQACSSGSTITPITCDTSLTCDTSADNSTLCDSGKKCQGVCRQACTSYVGNTTPNNGCPSTDVCNFTSYTNGFGNGYCIPNSTPRMNAGDICTSQSTLGGPAAAQGNCKAGLICNTASNKSCSSTAGGCSGICFPNPYQCNRTNLPNYFACPISFTCGGGDPKCIVGTIYQTQAPSCAICVPTADVTVTCKCDHPGVVGAGNNGYTCRNSITTQSSFCSTNQACSDDANATLSRSDLFNGQEVRGVRCQDPNAKELPPPPSPPCQHFNLNGGCDVVGSSIGQLNTQPGPFIIRMLNILLGAGGGIAVLLMMRAGYQIMSSQGNPEGIQKGREQLIAAIVGLLFLIFSFVLFQTIAVDILKIPGFH